MNPALEARVSTPLRGFSLEVELTARPGETLALVGPSGAGKTSLLRVVAGLMAPESGRVAIGDETWLDTERSIGLPAERRRCGFVFQEYALFPRMNAWRNVAFGMNLPRRQRRIAAVEMLDRFGLSGLADSPPGALSGGEMQRVALARALAAEPETLLLDEPLAALDTTTRRSALRELREVLGELRVPTMLVTHSFEEAALLAERLAIIDHGAIVQTGSPAEVSAMPRSPFVADFAGAVVLRGDATSEPDELTLVRLEGGGEIRSIDQARGPVAASVFPWEISLEPPGGSAHGSALNHIEGEVSSVMTVGNRARIGISVPQLLSAEVTAHSAEAMGLRPGRRVTAAWKASATRLIPLGTPHAPLRSSNT
jgi:molybdate transport system ATP-binding protein